MRKLEHQEPRIETGIIQFGDDWTGIFLRGDDCFRLSSLLSMIMEEYQIGGLYQETLRDWIELLDSSKENKR